MTFTKTNKGFTLIELLVVIAIIGILSSIVFPSMNASRTKSRDALRLAQITQVSRALEFYYDTYGRYPIIDDSNLFNVPGNWVSIMEDLNDEGYISASFATIGFPASENKFSLINTAYAAAGPAYPDYAFCSIQDPLYKEAEDYLHSYAYRSSTSGQSYRIRVRLENTSNPALQSSITGVFLDSETTGDTACDKNLGYYCMGL